MPPPPTPPPHLSLSPALAFLRSLPSRLRLPAAPLHPSLRSRRRLLLIPAALLLLFLTLFLTYPYFSSATVTVYVTPLSLERQLTLAVSSTTHPTLPTISATTDTVELEQTGSISTSGEALVGDRATGEVTIYNQTESPKELPAGTILTTTDNLRFTLDSTLTIASSSSEVNAQRQTIITPGQAQAQLTAAAIGADSNIPADTSLSVGSFPKSSLEAIVTSNFSGGTSRTIKAVSASDQEQLLAQLTQAINDQAAARSSTNDSFRVIPAATTITEQAFDKRVNEEADTLNLTLRASVQLLQFPSSQLHDLIVSTLGSDIPAGYTLDPATTIDLTDTSTDSSGTTTLTAAITASLLPDIPLEDYQRQLRRRHLESAYLLLGNISGFERLEIAVTPKIPLLSTRLPARLDRIDLELLPL